MFGDLDVVHRRSSKPPTPKRNAIHLGVMVRQLQVALSNGIVGSWRGLIPTTMPTVPLQQQEPLYGSDGKLCCEFRAN